MNYPSPLNRPDEYFNLKGNGGILSTPGDMYRWQLALMGNKVLSETARQKLFTPHIKEYEDGDSYYGYGWVVQEYGPGDTLIWHNGGAMPHGWSCAVYHFVDDDIICIVFANATIDGSLPVDDIVSNLADIAMDKEITFPPEVVMVDLETASWVEGMYSYDGGTFEVQFSEDRLRISPVGQQAVTALFPSPYDKMLPKYNGKTVEVVRLMAAGNYSQASSYFQPGPEGDIWKHMSREWWETFKTLGKFRDITPLGTVFASGAHTYCRLHFESGSEICQFFWMGGRCGGMTVADSPLAKDLLPQSITGYAGYNLKSGSVVEVEFSREGKMLLTGGEGTIQSQKE